MQAYAQDRFGLLLRPSIAREMRQSLHRMDAVQLIAEDWLGAPAPWLHALRVLAGEVPIHLHGVGLGLASVTPVGSKRLDEIARLIDAVRPERWREGIAL